MKLLPEVHNEHFNIKQYKRSLLNDVFVGFNLYCNEREINIHYQPLNQTFCVTQKDVIIGRGFQSRKTAIIWIIETDINL